ncbi:protein phosphatase 2c, putative [Ichthyophthirius multifiliis]|uniref:protein-serine/threonine phosphatase n=1 Tax=Ichthyophthirius multifiliis TaxID=5932 RepID=G0QJU7_ICHMU|nr:protein phosphatase 2c, putative [Ichthyophthirius multifiliis]EGR34512.1 protein phosphatase 2c, putative [Ichthyophthirius multifiliis]|eukprot:XP_004039816.1 protein phosphatase 2c, putative [Ichthyophthirius multifiliis]
MGCYLSSPITLKDTEKGQNNRFEYTAVGMQGWRTNMEDSHIANLNFDGEDKSIFGVFDGHGGKEVAKFVKKYFIQELKANQSYKIGNYTQALEDTFFKMDQLIASADGKRELENSNSGCTANVCLIVNNKIYCANSGDSRTVVSQGGKAVALSEDHKPDNLKEKERIQKAGGDVFNGRVNGNLNLSRALGDLEYKTNMANSQNKDPKSFLITALPDIKEFDITQETKFIVLGCDGIWECKSNQEIINYFSESNTNMPLDKRAENFLDSILASSTMGCNSGLDNMTIIIVKIKN